MNIDERLKRLAERHEALTQTVELIGHLQQKNEEAHRKNEILLEKNQILIAEITESVNSLARIAHSSERRISNPEDGRT
jgi:hypothetical protein